MTNANRCVAIAIECLFFVFPMKHCSFSTEKSHEAALLV